MSWDNIPLLVILVLAVLGNNQSVAVAAGFLLIVKLLGLENLYPVLEANGMTIGITVLTIAILTPLATGRVSAKDIAHAFSSPIGLIAVLAGVFAAWAAGQGLPFIKSDPDIVSPLVLGTVVGVCFLQGIAIGPLIAAGLVSLLMTVFNLFR